MVSKEALKENIDYFNKLYDDGVCHKAIRAKISSFEYNNEWGTKYRPHHEVYGFNYCPLPWGWKDKLKIFKI
jgi:hypothetical protein